MKNRRAVSKEDKDKKCQRIIDAAAKLFSISQYKDIKMIDIAREVGIAKGTVFFYYKTKEELFLELTRQEFAHFFTSINEKLQQYLLEKKKLAIDDFIMILESSFSSSRLMARLSVITDVILEQNIDYDTAKEFKLFMHSNVRRSGQLMEACVSSLPQNAGYRILMWAYMLIIGLQHFTDPSKIVREVIERENLPEFLPDFHSNFREILRALLLGIKKFE